MESASLPPNAGKTTMSAIEGEERELKSMADLSAKWAGRAVGHASQKDAKSVLKL